MSHIGSGLLLVLLVGTIAVALTTVLIAITVSWYKARDKELRLQGEMRIREMEHLRSMKQLELEIERVKASQLTHAT